MVVGVSLTHTSTPKDSLRRESKQTDNKRAYKEQGEEPESKEDFFHSFGYLVFQPRRIAAAWREVIW